MTGLNHTLQELKTELPGEQDGLWQPLLTGASGERALAVLREIVAHLPGAEASYVPAASLAGGKAGIALLSAYMTLAGFDDGGQASLYLEQAVQAVSSEPMGASLYSGFTGVAWATAHLQKQLGDADEEDSCGAVDEALRNYLAQSPWQDDYDLINGLVGFGVYAIERLPHASGVALLESVIDRLDETAERNSEGITWFTSPELLPPQQLEMCPHGYYNLGLAHGVPGVIALLGEACAAGVATEKALALLQGAVTWLMSQKLTGSPGASFPSWAGPGISERASRLAWCYGDLGLAAALLYAARCTGETLWEREALEVARRAAERPTEQTGVVDAGLCHGAAGIAHIFNRMFQVTGEQWLSEKARHWFGRTLELRRPGEGVAGFAAYMPEADGKERWVDDPGVLTGAAGIALALLAAIAPVEPAWDRMLLVSIPKVGGGLPTGSERPG